MKRFWLLPAICLLSALSAVAKNDPVIVLTWPTDKPALKLTFGKFLQQSSMPGQNFYVSSVTVENLTDKAIPRVLFTVYFLDKSNVRIGQGTLSVADLDGKQSARMQFQFNSVGVPASLVLSAKKDMLAAPGEKTIPLKVISVPPGANLKVDGKDSGVTPVMVHLTIGTHQLDLTKEGYAPGTTPVDVGANELPGGSITVELGGLSRDTVELRDGTVLLGDVLSMSLTEVTVRIDGKDQAYPRNQIKKLILVERVNSDEQKPATQPAQPKPH